MTASPPPTDPPPKSEVTQLLLSWKAGDEVAAQELVQVLYGELNRLAHHSMSRESAGHTLQTTALVNEAYMRLVGSNADWQSRQHFLGVASKAMRQVLVDHARKRHSKKRGENPVHLDLDSLGDVLGSRDGGGSAEAVLELDEALKRLSALDERKGRAVELHYFGGLSYDEVAEALDISAATVHRDLRMARAWLRKELDDGA
jgi:RNA polymerase sigma factor (TIGR02999 family)